MLPHALTEGILGPGLEPVDGAAVDERGELAEAVAEGVPNGTEGQDDMEVLLAAVDKEVEEGQWSELPVLVLGQSQWPHCLRKREG